MISLTSYVDIKKKKHSLWPKIYVFKKGMKMVRMNVVKGNKCLYDYYFIIILLFIKILYCYS